MCDEKFLVTLWIVISLVVVPTAFLAGAVPSYDFATPVFGLAVAPDGSLLVADAGSGIVELRKGEGSPVTELPGVTDVDPIGRWAIFAVAGAGDLDLGWRLFRVSRGNVQENANLLDFETNVNPGGGVIDSNPFDVEALMGGKALVAGAAGTTC